MEHNQAAAKAGMTIVRTFNASKETVFNAFSEAEALAQWWGPAGSTITVVSLDFRRGGAFHYKMEAGGQIMWGRFLYGDIVRPDIIEFVSSFSDESGNVCKSPFPMDFPMEIFNRLTLEEVDSITTLKLTGYPLNATAAQEAIYQSIIPNMQQGFAGTFDQLEKYLGRSLTVAS